MTETILRRVLLILVMTIFCGVVFHAPMSVWLGTILPDHQQIIKAWKELLIVMAVVVAMLQVGRHHLWRQLWCDWVIRLSLAYSAVHVMTVAIMPQGLLPTIAGLMIDLRFVLFFVVVYAALQLYPWWRRPLLTGGLVAAFLSLCFVLLQVTVLPHDALKHIGYDKDTTIAPYMTVDQNYDYVRVNGTLRGPNPLGAYAIIVLAVGLSALTMAMPKLRKIRHFLPWVLGVVVVLSVVALWFSYSRSAVVVGIAAIGCVVGLALWRYSSRLALIAGGVAVVVGVLVIIGQWNSSLIQNILLHRNAESSSMVGSNEEHAASLEEGWRRMVAQPLGAGVGSTGSASLLGDQSIIIENQYLFIAHEVGWLGMGLFGWLYGVLLVRLYQRRDDYLAFGVLISGIGLALIGLLLPVWADDTVSLVWWGLAAVAIASRGHKKERKSDARSS